MRVPSNVAHVRAARLPARDVPTQRLHVLARACEGSAPSLDQSKELIVVECPRARGYRRKLPVHVRVHVHEPIRAGDGEQRAIRRKTRGTTREPPSRRRDHPRDAVDPPPPHACASVTNASVRASRTFTRPSPRPTARSLPSGGKVESFGAAVFVARGPDGPIPPRDVGDRELRPRRGRRRLSRSRPRRRWRTRWGLSGSTRRRSRRSSCRRCGSRAFVAVTSHRSHIEVPMKNARFDAGGGGGADADDAAEAFFVAFVRFDTRSTPRRSGSCSLSRLPPLRPPRRRSRHAEAPRALVCAAAARPSVRARQHDLLLRRILDVVPARGESPRQNAAVRAGGDDDAFIRRGASNTARPSCSARCGRCTDGASPKSTCAPSINLISLRSFASNSASRPSAQPTSTFPRVVFSFGGRAHGDDVPSHGAHPSLPSRGPRCRSSSRDAVVVAVAVTREVDVVDADATDGASLASSRWPNLWRRGSRTRALRSRRGRGLFPAEISPSAR